MSETRRPFRIQSDIHEEDLPRWHLRTDDGQLRGPLSDRGLKALAEVGILTSQAVIRPADAEKFVPIQTHPIWPQIKILKTELMLTRPISLHHSQPPISVPPGENVFAAATVPDLPAFWSVRADFPTARDSMREVSARARTHRAKLEAQHVAKMTKIFAALRIAGVLRVLREIFLLALFLALGDLFRRGFIEALGAARWLAVFGVVLLAASYYLIVGFLD